MLQNMLPEENEAYGAYELPYQPASSASVGVLDIPPVTQTPPVQEASQPPKYPPGPQTSPPPPRKRPGRAGAILLLTFVLALIFGVGLFAGLEFTSGKSSASTTSRTVATATATSSSGTTLEAQQEAAIAKIEPAVVEIKVITVQGELIWLGGSDDTHWEHCDHEQYRHG